jgi:hypothetical protein
MTTGFSYPTAPWDIQNEKSRNQPFDKIEKIIIKATAVTF